MPLINLIQEQRLATKRSERQARSYFFAFVGVAAMSSVGYLGLLLETESMQSQESKLNAQLQRLRPLTTQIEANEKQYGELSPRIKTLEDAQLYTARWDRVLKHLSHQTPDHTWLSAVRCMATDPQKPVSMSVFGMSLAQEPIGEFILRLQNSTDLDNVQLKYTQEKIVNMAKGIEFEVDMDIAGSIEQKQAVKQEKTEGQS